MNGHFGAFQSSRHASMDLAESLVDALYLKTC